MRTQNQQRFKISSCQPSSGYKLERVRRVLGKASKREHAALLQEQQQDSSADWITNLKNPCQWGPCYPCTSPPNPVTNRGHLTKAHSKTKGRWNPVRTYRHDLPVRGLKLEICYLQLGWPFRRVQNQLPRPPRAPPPLRCPWRGRASYGCSV